MRWDERVGKRIKLRDLHLLEAAVQTGSLAKAAKSVGMSQPAVSYAIAEMEKLLGSLCSIGLPKALLPRHSLTRC